MSAKTYVGWSQSGDNTVFPNRKYLFFSFDEERLEYRSRLGYPSRGSGPWLVARPHVGFDTPSTEDVGGSVYSVRIGSRVYGRGANRVSYTQSIQFEYTTYGGYDLKLRYREPLKVEKYLKGYRFYYKERFYRLLSRPDWLSINWPVSAEGYSLGQRMLDTAIGHIAEFELIHDKVDTYYGTGSPWIMIRSFDFSDAETCLRSFRDSAELYLLTGILPGPWARGLETAYTVAAEQLPEAATNVAANVLEAAQLLAGLFSGQWVEQVPKSLKKAWLAYRYQYTTTKLDVREVKDVFSRLDSLAQHNTVRTFGSYVRGDIKYSVGFEVDTSQIIPSDVSETLQRFGLRLDAVNVWDMIPFSFVVDWFLPVQDILEYFQSLDACQLEPKDIWWSIETSMNGYDIYVRLPGRKLSTLPYLRISSASKKTVMMRIADAIALFT